MPGQLVQAAGLCVEDTTTIQNAVGEPIAAGHTSKHNTPQLSKSPSKRDSDKQPIEDMRTKRRFDLGEGRL